MGRWGDREIGGHGDGEIQKGEERIVFLSPCLLVPLSPAELGMNS